MRWNRHTILDEIRELHRSGEELNYTSAEENHLHLVRAAAWHYGTWKQAVELAGLDYDSVSKYRRWTRERVIQAIRDHHKAGHDLSWRSISIALDPPLAAAALRPNVGFQTWREAVTAAGLNHDEIARYRHWTPERVTAEIAELAKKGSPLSSKLVQLSNQSLYCAAKRRFTDWDAALAAAGVDPDSVRLRRAPNSAYPRRRRNSVGQLTLEHIGGPAEKRRSGAKSARKLSVEAGAPNVGATAVKERPAKKSSTKPKTSRAR
ncbi:hypothetical protein EON80_04070 [bacterium]|nr:MAG: hypothetical protein EON80_04070 [bacterium]